MSEQKTPDRESYIRDEIAEISFIYQTLFPGCEVTLWLGWDEGNTTFASPEILPDDGAPEADGDLLDQIRLNEGAGGPVTVSLRIPRPATEGELERHDDVRPMQSRLPQTLFKLSPMLFEQVKYMVEARGERKRSTRHQFSALPFNRPQALDQPDPRAAGGKPPAILIGFHWLEVGGAEKLGFDTVLWALEAGLRVFIISDRVEQQRLAHKLPEDPNLHFVRIDRYLERGRQVDFLENLVGQENIRALHNHHCGILYEALPTLLGRYPDLLSFDSTHITEYHDGGYPRVSGVWSNYIDMHHVISNDLAQFYESHFGVGDKARLGRLLHKGARDTAPLPIRMQAGQGQYRVAFVGRMAHQKRPIVVIEILRRLAKWGQRNDIDFRFDVVGEGPYRAVVETLVQRYGLSDRVTLHPANSDVPGLFRQSDIMLLPSANEGLALVCYEAIEQGCIPVTTDVGAQREIIPQELLVPRPPMQAARATVWAVQKLISDQGFIDRMGDELGEKYRELSSNPTAKELLMPYYKGLLVG